MQLWSTFKMMLSALFAGDARRSLEQARTECLSLAAATASGARGHLPESLAGLINAASPAQLHALRQLLRDKATRRVNGMDLPELGRSSVEGNLADRFGSSLAFWGSVSPVINFEMLALLKHLWLFNPDMAQYVSNIINMANTGHQVTVEASSPRRAEQIISRLNESASRLYRNGAGVDGLINAYLAQVAWSGALSSEDVVDFARRRVEKVVIVPVEQIRFRYLDGEYVAHQQPGTSAGLANSPLGLIRLNEETYRYYALQTVENSPYAKPPASAAVAPITGPQTDMLDNIKYVAKKFGLMGLISIAVTRPEKEGDESDEAYLARAGKYLARVGAAAQKLSNQGLVVTFDDQKVEHDNIASDARGAFDIFQMNEQQVFSGMASIPAFHGRTDSTTETYAGVVYNLLKAQAGGFQRLVKRRQEATYRLDLRLAGIPFDGLSVGFNKAHARKPLEEAQADEVRARTAIVKAEKGIISADQAAQELGYDSAYDATLLAANPDAARSLRALSGERVVAPSPLTLRFDQGSQSYRMMPEVINL